MDLEVLKKKIYTFIGDAGRLRITDDHLLLEILSEWETWTGAAEGFYKAIGVVSKDMSPSLAEQRSSDVKSFRRRISRRSKFQVLNRLAPVKGSKLPGTRTG